MAVKEFDASQYTTEELKLLVEKLSKMLGLVNNTELNLQDEVLDHYLRCKRIAELAEQNFTEKPSAMASALNVTTAALKELSRQEVEIYNAEACKALQSAFINTLKEFPEVAEQILERFYSNLESQVNGS